MKTTLLDRLVSHAISVDTPLCKLRRRQRLAQAKAAAMKREAMDNDAANPYVVRHGKRIPVAIR